MKIIKKVFLFSGFIAVVIALLLTYINTKRIKEYTAPTKEYIAPKDATCFSAEIMDECHLYGFSNDGSIYTYSYEASEPSKQVGDENLIFYKNKGRSLIIKQDGTIFLDQTGGFNGKKIGKVPGAIMGDFSEHHVAVVTKDGELFMYGENKNGEIGQEGTVILNQFTKINNIPYVRKVVCGEIYSCILSSEDELWISGKLGTNQWELFTKQTTTYPIKDVDGGEYTIFYLDTMGDLYCFGTYPIEYESLNGKVEGLSNIQFISVARGNTAVIDKEGNIYYIRSDQIFDRYWDRVEPIKIAEQQNVVELYCTEHYVYTFDQDKIKIIPVNQKLDRKK